MQHTIQGRMGYTPEVFRLEAGFSKSFMRGTLSDMLVCSLTFALLCVYIGVWELKGYGLMSLYKSDWVAIGGENVEEYGEVWGGEDWDCMDRYGTSIHSFSHPLAGQRHSSIYQSY